MTQVEKLYVEYFLRPGDYSGVQYWTNVLSHNPNALYDISASFAGSTEYQQTYAGMNNTQLVQAVYHNLFGRAAEAGGLAFWTQALDEHRMTVTDMVTNIAAAAQNNDRVVLDARVTVAESFTQHLDLASEQAAYSGVAANQIAKDFLGSIVDLTTAATAINPSSIDETIAQIVGNQTSFNAVHHLA